MQSPNGVMQLLAERRPGEAASLPRGARRPGHVATLALADPGRRMRARVAGTSTTFPGEKMRFVSKTGVAAVALVAAVAAAHAETAVDVQILSATIKDKQIDGATVTLQRNGEQSATGTTNAQGQVAFAHGVPGRCGLAADREEAGVLEPGRQVPLRRHHLRDQPRHDQPGRHARRAELGRQPARSRLPPRLSGQPRLLRPEDRYRRQPRCRQHHRLRAGDDHADPQARGRALRLRRARLLRRRRPADRPPRQERRKGLRLRRPDAGQDLLRAGRRRQCLVGLRGHRGRRLPGHRHAGRDAQSRPPARPGVPVDDGSRRGADGERQRRRRSGREDAQHPG